jgi:uncharacterized protein (DUF1501 family)
MQQSVGPPNSQRVPAQAEGNADLYMGQAAALTSRLQTAETDRQSLAVGLTLAKGWYTDADERVQRLLYTVRIVFALLPAEHTL